MVWCGAVLTSELMDIKDLQHTLHLLQQIGAVQPDLGAAGGMGYESMVAIKECHLCRLCLLDFQTSLKRAGRLHIILTNLRAIFTFFFAVKSIS